MGARSVVTAETVGGVLAHLNAGLNLTSALFLLAGFRYIRQREIGKHMRCMIGAVIASGLFLVFYVLRFSLTGTHTFAGPEAVRPIYLAILFSHMILAVVIVPMVIRLIQLARRERFTEHRRLARWTFPAWVYTSLTGLFVYYILYHAYG